MVIKTRVRHFEYTISAGATKDGEWKLDRNITIKHIFFRKDDGSIPYKTTVTFKLERVDITEDKAPVSIFGSDKLNALPLDWDVDENQTLKWSIYNGEGADITLYMDIVFEERA